MNNIDNNGNIGNIAICVFPHIAVFCLILIINATLYITRYRRIIFQARKFWWQLLAQLKHKGNIVILVLLGVCENLDSDDNGK